MVTKILMVDALEHTTLSPIITQISNDINRAILKDSTASLTKVTMYEDENAAVDDPASVYDNMVGGTDLQVTYDITDQEGLNPNSSSYTRVNYPIIADPVSGIAVNPIYLNTDLKLTFKYISQTKLKAIRIINSLKSYAVTSNYSLVHNPTYSYLLPNLLISFLEEVNTLKESTLPTNDFIDSISVVNFDRAIKRGTDREVPVFRGKAINTPGYITTDPSELKVEKDGQDYIVEFTYEFSIQQCHALSLRFPLVISNRPLSNKWSKYTPILKECDTEFTNNHIDVYDIYNNVCNDVNNSLTKVDVFTNIPAVDKFFPELISTYRDLVGLYTIQLIIDREEPTLLVVIDSLRALGVEEEIICYIENSNEYELFSYTQSMVYIQLFENEIIKNKGLTKVDDSIVVTKTLNIEKSYNLTISLVSNFGLIANHKERELENLHLGKLFKVDMSNEELLVILDGTDAVVGQ